MTSRKIRTYLPRRRKRRGVQGFSVNQKEAEEPKPEIRTQNNGGRLWVLHYKRIAGEEPESPYHKAGPGSDTGGHGISVLRRWGATKLVSFE